MRALRWWVLVVLSACSGGTPHDDAGMARCEPDRECPESAPVWGGACEGSLRCPFETSCGPGNDDVYECAGGQWSLAMPGCVGGGPPIAESCRTPFSGTLLGTQPRIARDLPGAPAFRPGDTIDFEFGAQGLAMVPFRVHIDGVDPPSAPTCVRLTTTLSLDGASAAPAARSVRLRCGSSLRVQEILPELPCELRSYAVRVEVTVESIGTVDVDLQAMGGCPRGP